MSDPDDLKLNTLHRFTKHSPRLVLQEYSHCEVPAGCGGVVIRWYDPTAGAPASVRLLLRGSTGEVWLDGTLLASSYCQLAPGEHVIAIHVEPAAPGLRLASLGASYATEDEDDETDLLHGRAEWRIATTAPTEAWIQRGFSDRTWAAPTPATPEALASLPEDDRWGIDAAVSRGQPVFALPDGPCWIRVSFTTEAR